MVLGQHLTLLGVLGALALAAWAFRSGRGRRLAYAAVLLLCVEATLCLVAAIVDMAKAWQRGDAYPIPFVYIAFFVGTIALGYYGYATRRRDGAMPLPPRRWLRPRPARS